MPRGERCAVCSRQTRGSGEPLLRCSRCHMIRYCGREHQMQHFRAHKDACTAVKRAVDAAAHAKEDLLAVEGVDIFRVGRFWGMYETRPYMLSLASQIEALERMGTDASLRVAIDVLFECLRLNRRDNMGLRDIAPGIFLRLNEDQHAYDFLRWWAQDRPTYDWENAALPYLDIRGADATESPESANFIGPFGGPSLLHLVALVLVKLRVRDSIEARGCFRVFLAGTMRERSPLSLLGGQTPALRLIQAFSAPPPSAVPLGALQRQDNSDKAIATNEAMVAQLDVQLTKLLRHTARRNPRIWHAIVNPNTILGAPNVQADAAVGDENEIKMAVVHLLPAYMATPRALARLQAHEAASARHGPPRQIAPSSSLS